MGDDVKPEDEENRTFVEKMLTERMILLTAACIFLICVLVYEWEAVFETVARVFRD